MNTKTIAYDLGELAYQNGVKACLPFKDEAFVAYVAKFDPPIVPFAQQYIEGYHASETRALARRAQFTLHTSEDT